MLASLMATGAVAGTTALVTLLALRLPYLYPRWWPWRP